MCVLLISFPTLNRNTKECTAIYLGAKFILQYEWVFAMGTRRRWKEKTNKINNVLVFVASLNITFISKRRYTFVLKTAWQNPSENEMARPKQPNLFPKLSFSHVFLLLLFVRILCKEKPASTIAINEKATKDFAKS